MRPRLYLETTIPSYLVARPHRDLVVAGHQQVTREWWEQRRHLFDLFVSAAVIAEMQRGDPDLAARRLSVVAGLPVLEATDRVEELAATYARELGFAQAAGADAVHLAFATVFAIDYLLTWNCAHLANGRVQRELGRVGARLGLVVPTVCTPEELMED